MVTSSNATTSKADFSTVTMSSLRKYKKQYRMRLKPTNNKGELAEAVSKHFAQLPAPKDEIQVIESFAAAVRQMNSDATSTDTASTGSLGTTNRRKRRQKTKSTDISSSDK